jgi:hypothetical protein
LYEKDFLRFFYRPIIFREDRHAKYPSNCEPGKDILTGSFNPEIFTASLAEVIRYYQTDQAGMHSIYTYAGQFFAEGTYATEGMKTVLNAVFARYDLK